VEEALIEMYLAGVSVRRVEDITEALWGTRVSPSTVSNLNKKIYSQIEAWRLAIGLPQDPHHLLFREPRLAHPASSQTPVSQLNQRSENPGAGHMEGRRR
jgi:hypothetical protein